MPRNIGTGGKKKNKGKKNFETIRELAFKEEGQEYGQNIRLLGNCHLEILCSDQVKRDGHIRGTMRKRAFVNMGDIVLVQLREFEPEKCDILLKYTEDEVRKLKQAGEIPENFKINEKTENDNEEGEEDDDDDFITFEKGDKNDHDDKKKYKKRKDSISDDDDPYADEEDEDDHDDEDNDNKEDENEEEEEKEEEENEDEESEEDERTNKKFTNNKSKGGKIISNQKGNVLSNGKFASDKHNKHNKQNLKDRKAEIDDL